MEVVDKPTWSSVADSKSKDMKQNAEQKRKEKKAFLIHCSKFHKRLRMFAYLLLEHEIDCSCYDDGLNS